MNPFSLDHILSRSYFSSSSSLPLPLSQAQAGTVTPRATVLSGANGQHSRALLLVSPSLELSKNSGRSSPAPHGLRKWAWLELN